MMNSNKPIIDFMVEHLDGYNGSDKEIGWYMCIPMDIIAKQLDMSLNELMDEVLHKESDE